MEMKKIATRDSYGNALKELGAEYSNLVVLDADLAGATKTGTFQKVYPDRHFDCGIAEANMICVAAGMSTTGLVPFASSFAMFAAGRAFEQVRNSIGYPHLNVKIGATHGGISVGEDGASHQCCEDFALMRSIPGMTVICPADDVEARAAVRAAYHHNGPVYLRFGRLAVPVIHEEGYNFRIGKGEVLRDGSDIAIIANGLLVYEAVVAAKELAKEGINAMVINMATVKPLDEELIPILSHVQIILYFGEKMDQLQDIEGRIQIIPYGIDFHISQLALIQPACASHSVRNVILFVVDPLQTDRQ